MEEYEIDISGLDKAEILQTLYNHAIPLGLGFLQSTPEEMTIEVARELVAENTYFDYVFGRPLKVNLKRDVMRTDLYDRDQGSGSAKRLITELRNKVSK